MQRSFIFLISFLTLTGCQVYMDPRNEPLMLVTEEEWSELTTVKETNFEIEPDPVQPPPELPGSSGGGWTGSGSISKFVSFTVFSSDHSSSVTSISGSFLGSM